MERPLEGVCVVAVEQAVAAPFATRQLADLGARVIKVERRDGGDFARAYDATVAGTSSVFAWLNRSKESMTLDLKHPGAAEVLARLVARADVVVQNLAPGAAARLGLSAATLRQARPALVVCDISGYGEGGPYSGRKAYDMLIQAEAGVMSVTGTPETPARVGISVADIAAGVYAFSGVLAALFRRERTGQGAEVTVSLFDALVEWMSHPLYFTMYGGSPPPRVGSRHALIAPYGVFETGDGTALLLAVQNESEWRRFCATVLDDPTVADDPRFAGNGQRIANRDDVEALVSSRLLTLTGAEALSRLQRADVAHAQLRPVGEVADHPQLQSRHRWQPVDGPGGSFNALVPPIGMSDFTPRMDPVPALGADTDHILGWLDYGPGDVSTLHDTRVV